jgi:hypothetical protein
MATNFNIPGSQNGRGLSFTVSLRVGWSKLDLKTAGRNLSATRFQTVFSERFTDVKKFSIVINSAFRRLQPVVQQEFIKELTKDNGVAQLFLNTVRHRIFSKIESRIVKGNPAWSPRSETYMNWREMQKSRGVRVGAKPFDYSGRFLIALKRAVIREKSKRIKVESVGTIPRINIDFNILAQKGSRSGHIFGIAQHGLPTGMRDTRGGRSLMMIPVSPNDPDRYLPEHSTSGFDFERFPVVFRWSTGPRKNIKRIPQREFITEEEVKGIVRNLSKTPIEQWLSGMTVTDMTTVKPRAR